jgi:hypothetical protein
VTRWRRETYRTITLSCVRCGPGGSSRRRRARVPARSASKPRLPHPPRSLLVALDPDSRERRITRSAGVTGELPAVREQELGIADAINLHRDTAGRIPATRRIMRGGRQQPTSVPGTVPHVRISARVIPLPHRQHPVTRSSTGNPEGVWRVLHRRRYKRFQDRRPPSTSWDNSRHPAIRPIPAKPIVDRQKSGPEPSRHHSHHEDNGRYPATRPTFRYVYCRPARIRRHTSCVPPTTR